jgi:Holliday junction resolvase RusA-like endonuclease
VPDLCTHGRMVSQSCPGCGNAPAAERERLDGCYRVIIPGNPGACRVNARAKPIVRKGSKHATIILTDGYKSWRSLAIACMRRAAAGPLLDLRAGPVEVRVTAYWPSKHAKGEAVGLAFGDVDAVAKACLDALKVSTPKKPGAGVITDDSQVVALTCTKAHDKRNPRIEIEVRRANG